MTDPKYPGVPVGPLNAGGKVGWWRAGEDGSSLHPEETGMVWGDFCADAVDRCIDEIISYFRESWDRNPTKKEVLSGIMFTLNVYDDNMELVDNDD